MSKSYYNIESNLTPARLLSNVHIVGQYLNGPSNNGVGATLTTNVTSMVIDNKTVEDGNRIVLINQNSAAENGIYTTSGVGINIVFTRAPDFQSVEQMLAGQTLTIGDGGIFSGVVIALIAPVPNYIGIDAIEFITHNNPHIVNFNSTISGLTLGWGNATTILVQSGSAYNSQGTFLMNLDTLGVIDFGTTGPGGKDTPGPPVAGQAQAVYLIGNDNDPNFTSLVYSQNFTQPAPQVGYNIYRRIGRLTTTNAGDGFIAFSCNAAYGSNMRLYNVNKTLIGSGTGNGTYVDVSIAPYLANILNGSFAIPVILTADYVAPINNNNENYFLFVRTPNLTGDGYSSGGKNVVATVNQTVRFTFPPIATAQVGASYGVQVMGSNGSTSTVTWQLFINGFLDYV